MAEHQRNKYRVLSWCSWQYVDRLGQKGPIGTEIHSYNTHEGFVKALEQSLTMYGLDGRDGWVRSWVETITIKEAMSKTSRNELSR